MATICRHVVMTTDPSREEYGQIDLITSEETVQELLLVHSQPGTLLLEALMMR